ncbi:MAG TPA: hypothetical protein VNU95_04845 [Candidatus Acidoferrales bacterium]|jgi:hypothetical protein|nr:hypothetical protein [Candidatus Acidoferrales bacterium]
MKIATSRVLDVVLILCLLNWFAWGWIGDSLGGDAFQGKVEGDRYFLGSHGKVTQVSRKVYIYSVIHGYTAFTGWVVMILVVIIKLDGRNKKAPSAKH